MLDGLSLKLRLPETFGGIEVFSPREAPQVQLELSGDVHHLTLKKIPLYSIVLLKE
jgi:hypothetical protein